MPDNRHDRKEHELAELFQRAVQPGPVPDRTFLDRLREKSAAEFDAAAEGTSAGGHDKTERESKIMVYSIRALVTAATAAAIAAGVFFMPDSATHGAAADINQVLNQLPLAKTLHVELERDGQSGTAWILNPGRVRFNDADGTYRIVRDEREWEIDEKANRAASRPARYFRKDGKIDPLRLLKVADTKGVHEALKKATVRRIERDGRSVDLYAARIAGEDEEASVRIECFVDARTGAVRSLRSFSVSGERIKPIAEVRILAVDEAVDEDLFIVGDTLTEDGRIGKVSDVQGIVSVKPVMHRRFTPVTSRVLVQPGDWLRTDVRGANAVAVRLVKETDITLGPGTLVELPTPRQIKIVSGEIKIVTAKKRPIELVGPDGSKTQVVGTAHYRVDRATNKLVVVAKPPVWLAYFEGTSTQDSIGSLVANVDGRNVPLTVGYHKVTVDVRDQIARTVIEESFVNRTNGRLEGVFYFPLPQDASISGFGMWIGSELVEADVVEKQRAREIYETILRERRDPGLLEWTGGNLFKARVFPIEAHSEKRIKISYTQVLPMKNGRYRYSYALRSELLKLHPLRELAIDVRLSSVMPLADVTCPTHLARIEKTDHSAHVEFTAQEYTPDRDFEIVVVCKKGTGPICRNGPKGASHKLDPSPFYTLQVIPHRRGDDGYFTMLFTPPAPEGPWQRETLPDGEPIEMLILADTSGSMDRAARKNQADLVASLLGSLTPADRVDLATCDVDCHWVFGQSKPATEKNITTIRNQLDARISLGWTDLDRAFVSAAERCNPKTQLIYIGDGVVNTTDADPVAFAGRLKRLFAIKGSGLFSGDRRTIGGGAVKQRGLTPLSVHAVSVGSSYESIVLDAIASLSGGSVRQVSGEQTPQKVAAELLAEITQPAVRDLTVSFLGLRTARVYPEVLPNVAAGRQQVIVGRYLPEGADQQGEVLVTGTLKGERVTFRTKVTLADAEHGNSFIPRLWARKHLDALLKQGASPSIKEQIIALSEEYHIITPYTSLLVLESDEDRKRFNVKRRFQMRDGERFFADGRDRANFELMQKQMRLAGNWRAGLRRQVLRSLMGLGRDANVFGQATDFNSNGVPRGSVSFDGSGFGGGVRTSGRQVGQTRSEWDNGFDALTELVSATIEPESWDASDELSLIVSQRQDVDRLELASNEEREEEMFEQSARERLERDDKDIIFGDSDESELGQRMMKQKEELAALSVQVRDISDYRKGDGLFHRGKKGKYNRNRWGGFGGGGGGGMHGGSDMPSQLTADITWLTRLFPTVDGPPAAPLPPKVRWPKDARRLADRLLRTEQLASMAGGMQVERTVESFDPRWDTLTGRSKSLVLVSPKAWLARSFGDGAATNVQWCDEQDRGVVSVDFGLGRVRKSTPIDLAQPPLSLSGYVLRSIEQSYPQYDVELKPEGENRTLVVGIKGIKGTGPFFRNPGQPGKGAVRKRDLSPLFQVNILVDTQRHVVLRIENRQNGKTTGTTRMSDFVQVAGAWWATRVERFNGSGMRTSATSLKFAELDQQKFAEQMKKELAPRDDAQLLHVPLPTVQEAKQALADEKADFEDRIVLAIHFARIQDWKRVGSHLDSAIQITNDKPGMRWVRYALMKQSRRREELRKAIMVEAKETDRTKPISYFMATYLVGQASGVFSAGELLDTLRPAYQRQPKYVRAMKLWKEHRLAWLGATGQRDAVLELRCELAEAYPHDVHPQQQYASLLASTGKYTAAYDWLDRTIVPDRRWLPHEEESLRSLVTSFLQKEGRYEDLVEYLAGWMANNPTSENPYRQYLSALVKVDEEKLTNQRIAKWLAVEIHNDQTPLDPATAARLSAAIYQALGQGYSLHTNRLDQRWVKPLAKLVEQLATHKAHAHLADRVMNHGVFRQQDACRQLRRRMAARLTDEINTLPVARIGALVGWIWPNDPAVEASQWRKIAEGLKARWTAEQDANVRNQIAGPLVRILSGKLTADEHLAFLRRQLKEGPKPFHIGYVQHLFNALLVQPWTAAFEDEAFALLPQLSDAKPPSERLRVQVAALHRLTDRMVQARYAALMANGEHQEELTRTEQRELRRKNLRAAREGFAEWLQRKSDGAPEGLKPWLGVERLVLLVLGGDDLDQVTEACWELLGPAPAKPVRNPDVDEPQDVIAIVLTTILRDRHLAILVNLAARREAKPQLIDRLLAYYDIGIQGAGDDKAAVAMWQFAKYRFLSALDRPKDLEAALNAWIQPGDADNYWRRALAYLLAEQGKITEAIALLEQVQKADELSPDDTRALAGWYLVAGERDKHEQALTQVFKASEDWRLNQWLNRQLQPWQRSDTPMPDELDKDILRVFAALFEKSSSPQSYLWLLRSFYTATRDFRLLASLPDAVIGHTAGQIYPFLTSMNSVLSEIRDEATADSIVEQIEKVRERAKTTVDRRALDLLELLVERRSSEVLNQPGPHVDRALTAMRRAFDRKWSNGEPRLMADLLASLGRISQAPLADEQVRELTVLHDRAQKGTIDRLHIAHALARAHWSYARHDKAIDLLDAALAEYETAVDGVLPQVANGPIETLIGYLESRGQFARGETFLIAQLRHPANRQKKFWLIQRLVRLYNRALAGDGTVSLGSGAELYHGATRRIDEELNTDDPGHRNNMVGQLCDIYRTAKRKKIEGVVADLRTFAFERLPQVLGRQTNYQSMVGRVADTLKELAGPRDGLELLIERIENEPRWFRLNNQDGWSQHAYRLGQWRNEVGDKLGDLTPRLLAIVLAELERDLRSRQSRNRNMVHRQHGGYFWKAKAGDFSRVAERVYKELNDSGAAVRYIADYFWWGLNRRDRAIEILMIAHRQKILDESGQSRLVDFLHQRERYNESIPILLPLVESRPANIGYRVWLMHAYYRVDRPDDLLALLKATDEYFHEGGRWQENIIATLAQSCLGNHLFGQSAAYYEEVINLHQRTQPRRGIGNGTLSSYYWNLSQAYAGLKKTLEAVDAACGAIVSWGPRHDQRAHALRSLKQVLAAAPDLDAYIAELDQQAEETGQHNPMVRKAIGQVYFDKQQFKRAAVQFKLAIEFQPNDTETHQKLVACYDKLGDRDAAIAQLLESVRLSRRNVALYKDLAQRYETMEKPEQAERARTSIVEALPNESEGHTMLAEIRQTQDRWDDAMVHWQQVATIRELEPTGLLRLAQAQTHQQQWEKAAATCKRLRARAWPARFGNVEQQIRQLERRIDVGQKPEQ